ncbi:MAG TPA: hypothetical protein DHW80_06900 [Acinetobacter sp.]|uniref:hypothetical protein n=1 Tax=Acinetobacter variabilis TaxID=70346 RepID=UPI000EE226EA|nr:hypothetical protein [Acinetobacter variabilis]HCL59496.1 hypothetical protein [Acinetobacter sp.]
MSQAQEERRKQAWESHGKEAFESTFQMLRNLKDEIEKLPVGSQERAEKQEKYDIQYEDAFADYDKQTDF